MEMTSHPLFNHILYINLDSRPDRNEHVIQELRQLCQSPNQSPTPTPTQNIERFPAIVPPSKLGALGCTLSHLRCLEMAKEHQYPYVFICEDDIQFLQPQLLQENVQKFWENPPPQGWDVLIIGGNNFPPYEYYSDYAIHVHRCFTTTGYIVAQHYYDTLIENFKQSAELLEQFPEKKPDYALDVIWRKLHEPMESRWYMIIPPTVTQYSCYSDIEHCDVNYSQWLLDIK